MGRRAKPTKSKEAKPPVAHKASKDEGARVRDLEKRLAETLRDKAEALEQLKTRDRELAEAQGQQTATSEILRIISRSSTDLQPSFDTIAASALRLCGASYSWIALYDGELLHLSALQNVNPAGGEAMRRAYPRRADESTATGRAVRTRTVEQVPDVLEDPVYELKGELQTMGFRSLLAVPMLRDGEPIGVIGVGRPDPGRFSDQQIELLMTFADQAVIAIENVRLFNETKEALEQQTATSDVLRAISHSALDLALILRTVAESATKLCGAQHGHIFRFDGEVLRYTVGYGTSPELKHYFDEHPVPLGPGSASGTAASERHTIQIDDVLAVPSYQFGEAARLEGWRTALAVPMLKESALLGTITIWKTKVDPFTDRQIALVETFADQAVIAIENVRLFTELQE